MRFLYFLFALIFCFASAQASTPDEEARFLAGLPADSSSLETLARDESWQAHSSAFQRAWLDVEERQLGPIRGWMPGTLGYIYADPSPLFYMFSGPDMLYAHAFFPNASTYILCGREPVGELPNVADLKPAVRAAALVNLRTSLNAILSYSFFITADMKNDLTATQLSGTLPVILVFLARSGCAISSVEKVTLDDEGELTQGKSKTPGVRVVFMGTTGKLQTLYYFQTDLSNWGIKSNPGFMAFCAKQGQGNALIKAASYLMHMDEFSTVKDFLLSSTRSVMQDDSGIPFRFFKPEDWITGLYGNYVGPINLFKQYEQADLRAAFTQQTVGEIPFGLGYQWKPGLSSLLVATALRSVPKATSVAEPVDQ